MAETPKRGRPPKPKELPAESVEQAGQAIVKTSRNKGKTPSNLEAASSAKKEDVSRILSNCLKWHNMPKVKSVDELRERTLFFFTECIQNGEIPTWEKYCMSTGYYRQTLWDWVVGNSVSELGREANDIVKKAKEYLSAFESEMVTEGKINPVVYIFRAKNFFGMKDQQEYVLTPNTPLGDVSDPATLASRYEKLPDVKDEGESD